MLVSLDKRLLGRATICPMEGGAARLIRLAFLASDIVESIIEGRQPSELTAEALTRHTALPIDWRSQRAALNLQ